MNGDVLVVDDVPGAFTETVVDAYRRRPGGSFSLVVSGGPTARACYGRLADDATDAIDWWDVDVYWGDERCVPPDHPDSNENMVRTELLAKIGGVNAAFPMRCDEGVESYQLRVSSLDAFDVVHLGMGPDGHTASLFPGSDALESDPGQLVAFNTDPTGRNPHGRMTLTLSAIAKARHVVFTVSGEVKHHALQAVFDGADLPAARVRAPRITWLVDRDAAPCQLT